MAMQDFNHNGVRKDSILSQYAVYSNVILTGGLLYVFMIRHIFELIMPSNCHKDGQARGPFGIAKLRKVCAVLDETKRRGFINHIVSLHTKIIILAFGSYPFIKWIHDPSTDLDTPVHHGSPLTLGDMMLFSTQLFSANILHELFYRDNSSYLTRVHHVATASLAQVAVMFTIMDEDRQLAGSEWLLCMVWGAFDLFSEGTGNIVMIFRRFYPNSHRVNRNITFIVTLFSVACTIALTSIIIWLYAMPAHCKVWSLSIKILTPIVHCLFVAAQLWSASRIWQIYQAHQRELKREHQRGPPGDYEAPLTSVAEVEGERSWPSSSS